MRSELKHLSQVSTTRGIISIAIEWILIFIAIFLIEYFDSMLTSLLGLLFIAGRQHALAFCVHEGVHYNISRNRVLNDFLVNSFAAWPIFMEVKTYRDNHLAHHRHNNTEKDPDWARKQSREWVFPKRKLPLFIDFLRSFLSMETLKSFYAVSGKQAQSKGLTKKSSLPKSYHLVKAIYYLSFLSVFYYFNFLKSYLFYWFLPMITWLQVLNRLRKIAEHFGIYDKEAEIRTRTVIPNIIEKIFIAPKNIHFHCEHHYYPNVPYYNLSKLHHHLQLDPKYQKEIHLSYGYINVLREATRLN